MSQRRMVAWAVGYLALGIVGGGGILIALGIAKHPMREMPIAYCAEHGGIARSFGDGSIFGEEVHFVCKDQTIERFRGDTTWVSAQ